MWQSVTHTAWKSKRCDTFADPAKIAQSSTHVSCVEICTDGTMRGIIHQLTKPRPVYFKPCSYARIDGLKALVLKRNCIRVYHVQFEPSTWITLMLNVIVTVQHESMRPNSEHVKIRKVCFFCGIIMITIERVCKNPVLINSKKLSIGLCMLLVKSFCDKMKSRWLFLEVQYHLKVFKIRLFNNGWEYYSNQGQIHLLVKTHRLE